LEQVYKPVVVGCQCLQAEKLGCEGRIEEAQGVLKLCDQLKEERTALQEALIFAWHSTVLGLFCYFV